MGIFQKKEILWPLSFLVLILAFVYGQIIYYNQKIVSAVDNDNGIIKDNATTAALASVLEQPEIKLKFQGNEISVSSRELNNWIESYHRDYTQKRELRINTVKVSAYLEGLSKTLNTSPVNAKLVVSDGKVSQFEPPQNGRIVNISASLASIVRDLNSGNFNNVKISIDEISPAITLDNANKFGIRELLASGESDFSGSPDSRIHNINVGSRKFTGIMLEPGEEFSFNQWLGDVSAAAGYLPELVIKGGKLIPEYGGGLCQVSTTLFRAAINSGLLITERQPHSIPVRYYNPQGFDATIYPGVVDLRFKNDTPAYVLIQSKVVGSKLFFEIYGTKDGRQVKVDGPIESEIRTSGALKTELARTINYPDGTQKTDVFKSSYKAPGTFPTVRNPLE